MQKPEFDPYNNRGLFYNGTWQPANGSGNLPVYNPCNEEIVGRIQPANADDTRKAISSAANALAKWRAVVPWERAMLLHKVAAVMRQHTQDAAYFLATELGKPVAQGEREWGMAIDQFEWYGDEARRLHGDIIASRLPDAHYEVTIEPVGVVAAFTAWNFPPLLASRKIAPALAAGCSIVLRPSVEAPAAVLLLVDCCRHAGIPAGVVNVVVGPIDATYQPLVADKRVKKISLTGSTAVGKQMIRDCADTVKKMSMELGGNAPTIIFDDVDIPSVVAQAVASKHANAGQVCAAPDRFFVHAAIYKKFVAEYVKQVKKIVVGDSFDAATNMGPLVNQKRVIAVDKVVRDSIEKGAQLLIGGKQLDTKGFFYAPTVLADVTDDMLCSCEENFGPITAFTSFDNEEEVVQRANAAELGLAAYVFSKHHNRLRRVVSQIQTGMVAANTFALASAQMPFGGIKQSGYGREGGSNSMRDYCNIKVAHFFTGGE